MNLKLLLNFKNKPSLKSKKNITVESSSSEIIKNKTLSGCFYVFSKNYIDLFDGLDDRTFMYGEEVLLSIIMKNNNLISIYDPNIVINHLVGASVISNKDSLLKKQKFLIKNVSKSMRYALKEIRKGKKL